MNKQLFNWRIEGDAVLSSKAKLVSFSGLIIGAAVVLVSFQNCGQAPQTLSSSGSAESNSNGNQSSSSLSGGTLFSVEVSSQQTSGSLPQGEILNIPKESQPALIPPVTGTASNVVFIEVPAKVTKIGSAFSCPASSTLAPGCVFSASGFRKIVPIYSDASCSRRYANQTALLQVNYQQSGNVPYWSGWMTQDMRQAGCLGKEGSGFIQGSISDWDQALCIYACKTAVGDSAGGMPEKTYVMEGAPQGQRYNIWIEDGGGTLHFETDNFFQGMKAVLYKDASGVYRGIGGHIPTGCSENVPFKMSISRFSNGVLAWSTEIQKEACGLKLGQVFSGHLAPL